MKKLYTRFLLFLCAGTLCLSACKEDDLDFKSAAPSPTTAGLGTETGSEVGKDAEKVSVPVKVTLSAPASRAFEINVTANADTIQTLIANNTLKDVSVLPAGSFTLPNAVAVAYGASEVTFTLDVMMTTIERNFGKKLAIALRLTNPTKDNKLDPAKAMEIVVINTSEIIKAEDIHYIGFAKGSEIFTVPNGRNYSMDTKSVYIPLTINLAGTPSSFFNVRLASKQDTVAALNSSGVLKDAVAIAATDFTIDSAVTFGSGKSSAVTTLAVKPSVIFSPANRNKKLAVVLQLSNPNKHLIDPTRKNQVVLIDPSPFRYYNGSPFRLPSALGQSTVLHAEDYDFGGEGIAYHDNDASNNGGQYRPGEGVDIGGGNGDFQVGWTGDGEWITYSVIVPVNGTYEINTRTGSPNEEPGRFNISLDDQNVTGTVYTSRTGDYGIWGSTKKVVTLKAGSYVMKFFEEKGNYDFNDITFTLVDPAKVEQNVTKNAQFSVSRDNTSNENESAKKSVDLDPTSKFLLFDFTGVWLQLAFPSAQTITSYSITSANDADGRDPKDWELLGSNDGLTWSVVDKQTGYKFSNRFQTRRFTLAAKATFRYYKLDVTANNGEGLFQIGEWNLFNQP